MNLDFYVIWSTPNCSRSGRPPLGRLELPNSSRRRGLAHPPPLLPLPPEDASGLRPEADGSGGALPPSRVSGVAGPQHAWRCGRSRSDGVGFDGGCGRPCLGPRAAATAAGLDRAAVRCGLRRHCHLALDRRRRRGPGGLLGGTHGRSILAGVASGGGHLLRRRWPARSLVIGSRDPSSCPGCELRRHGCR